jgi:hypothetical protein
MQIAEITDPIQARRCRYAQYRGEKNVIEIEWIVGHWNGSLGIGR